MKGIRSEMAGLTAGVMGVTIVASFVTAQIPDHPLITEVYIDPAPAGFAGDGPVGRDLTNLHQEYVEIYLPTADDLHPDLNKQALRLTFYEVEGDTGSSGYTLINYRIDLPTFDLDSTNGITPGAIERPPSGVVVLAWADYVGNPPVLLGAPGSCVALVNGGVTSVSDYVIVAINGRQGVGCTNLDVPDPSNPDPDDALSFIHMPGEASSGIYQNGSAAYLLVNRDAGLCLGGTRDGLACDPAAPNCPPANVCFPGYVKLYDDKDTDHVPPIENADPKLKSGDVLLFSCFLGGDLTFYWETTYDSVVPGEVYDVEVLLALRTEAGIEGIFRIEVYSGVTLLTTHDVASSSLVDNVFLFGPPSQIVVVVSVDGQDVAAVNNLRVRVFLTLPNNGKKVFWSYTEIHGLVGALEPPCAINADCNDGLFCTGAETCGGGTCQHGPAVCIASCEHCNETAGSCQLCTIDLDADGAIGAYEISLLTGCFGFCYTSGACLAANVDGDPGGCVGTGDYSALAGCMNQICAECSNCTGPPAAAPVNRATDREGRVVSGGH